MRHIMYVESPSFVGLLSRPKISGVGRHVGVMLPDGSVAHMTRNAAEIVSLEAFAQSHAVRMDKAAAPGAHAQIRWRAVCSAGSAANYRLVDRNCEHYASWLMGEPPRSQQVAGAAVLFFFAALLMAR